jgi:hypothetical protein
MREPRREPDPSLACEEARLMLCDVARNLDEERLGEIQALERATGLTLVAFSCRSLGPEREERLRALAAELGSPLQTEPVQVSEDQLAAIRGLEGAMGLSLVAVEA